MSAVASAVIVWLCGPPCKPGKTEKLIFSSMSDKSIVFLPTLRSPLLKKIKAPLGPGKNYLLNVKTKKSII